MAAEKNFENKIKSYIESKGNWFIKYWAGADYTKEGIPDLLCCIDGRFVGIEVKAEKGRPKLLQLVTLKKIRMAGGIGVLLYPEDWEGFKNFIEKDWNVWYIGNVRKQEEWFKKLNR